MEKENGLNIEKLLAIMAEMEIIEPDDNLSELIKNEMSSDLLDDEQLQMIAGGVKKEPDIIDID